MLSCLIVIMANNSGWRYISHSVGTSFVILTKIVFRISFTLSHSPFFIARYNGQKCCLISNNFDTSGVISATNCGPRVILQTTLHFWHTQRRMSKRTVESLKQLGHKSTLTTVQSWESMLGTQGKLNFGKYKLVKWIS